MKKFIFIIGLLLFPFTAFCQTEWLYAYNEVNRPETIYDNITIDKQNCTITKNGKTYKLYGKVKIVDSFADLKVQIVNSFADIKVKIVDQWADECGKVIVTDSWPDLKVQIVTSFADIKVQMVENWPGF